MYLFIPALVRSMGVHALITYASACFGVVLAGALPSVHHHHDITRRLNSRLF